MKNILIYPHDHFNIGSGGITVHYNLAKILDESGQMVRIHPWLGNVDNDIFNKYYNNDFPIDDNCVVIYCEGILGNPLNAKYVVRWMLSELGMNVKYENLYGWGKNEIVYFFNSEKMINNNEKKIGSFYKFLSPLYLNPEIEVFNPPLIRKGVCFTKRKHFMHKNGYNILHDSDAVEIHPWEQKDAIHMFNQFETFISYDPLTFLTIMAPLCGCVSVVHPIEGVSELEWIKSLALYQYGSSNKIQKLYGISYGLEDIENARNTLHLAKDQWDEIISFNKNIQIKEFINDINNFDLMENTINNVYFN